MAKAVGPGPGSAPRPAAPRKRNAATNGKTTVSVTKREVSAGEKRINVLRKRRHDAIQGDVAAVQKQHEKGKLAARERIEKVLDPGSFVEFDAFALHRNQNFGMGNAGSSNQLLVIKLATVLSSNVFLGFQPGSSNNTLTLNNSAALRVTNDTGTGRLDIRRGTNELEGGTIEADQLLLTNRAGSFEFKGDLLITRSAFVSNNAPFVVGQSGTTPATWDVRAGPNKHLVVGDVQIVDE